MTSFKSHIPIDVEKTFDEFIQSVKGSKVSEIISKSPQFENADYIFPDKNIVIELKQLETEFSETDSFYDKLHQLHEKLMKKDPQWKPLLLGGNGKYPQWFILEFYRIYRIPLSRIIKKANRQIKQTKQHFSINQPRGILLFVNDSLTSIGPDYIISLAGNILLNSYSSIDCFIYLTVNRYVEVLGSDLANLVWIPVYSEKAEEFLVESVNTLGREWFDFLEKRIGPFDDRVKKDNSKIIYGSKSITSW